MLGTQGEALPLGGRKARALMAALLLHPRQSHSSQRLVDWLWGESASAGAMTTLRTHVSNVRLVLERAGAAGALVNRSGGYALMVDPSSIDTVLFERGVEGGQEALALGDPAAARARLQDALALWRGSVLSDLGGPAFAEARAAQLEELKVAAEEAAADAELAMGRHRAIVGRLQSLVAAHPFHERFTAQLMLALYRCGRQAEALSAYGSTRHRLSEDLGIDPGPELRELESAMLRQDVVLLGDEWGEQPRPVVRAAVHPPPDAVFAALRRTAMVGRTQELARLLELWSTTSAGGNAVAFLSAPVGFGKSRLTAEVAHRAADGGAVVVVGRCTDESVPYQSLASGFRASTHISAVLNSAPDDVRAALTLLVPAADGQSGTPLGRPGRHEAIVQAVQWLLRTIAGQQGLLLVIEDAERIDMATATLLRDLALHLPPAVMLLVCLRDPPGSRHPALLQLLGADPVRLTAEHIRLPPLSLTDVAALITGMTGATATADVVRRLADHTGGNPFFAAEIVRDQGPAILTDHAALSTVPAGVRDVLRQRVSSFPGATREALGAAAVLGVDADLTTLSALVTASEDTVVADLDPAVRGGFLVESGQSWAGAFSFPHELMRAAVYADIPVHRRQRLHVQAASALLSAPVVDDLTVIAAATHLQRAGAAADPAATIEVSRKASTAARRGFAWAEAVHHAESALTVLSRTAPPTERADAEVDLAILRLRSGIGYQRAIALLESALTTYVTSGDRAAAGAVHSRLGGALCVHHSAMDIPRALEHFQAAERLLPDPGNVFHLHRGRAQAAMYGLRTDILSEASTSAGELADRIGRPDLSVFAFWGRGWDAIDRGNPAAAFAALEQGWMVARDLGDAYLAWGPVEAAALFATELLLDPAAGRSWCRRGLSQPRFDSFTDPHASVVDQLGVAMIEMGELEGARRTITPLPADAVSRRLLGFCDGKWEQAVADWAAALQRDEDAGDRQDALLNARWCAEALLMLGRENEAVVVLDRALDVSMAGPQVPSEVWIRSRLATVTGAAAPVVGAAHVARCESIMASGQDWRGLRGEVLLAAGVVDAARGAWAAARQSFDDAAAEFLTYRLPWRRAATFAAWARALSAAGYVGEAADRREDARRVYRGIGAAERWLRVVDEPEAGGVASTSTTPQRDLNTVGRESFHDFSSDDPAPASPHA
ncbi:BTAD domain-containing putative transcriptional regulator [Nakamurella sp. GG22]